VVFWFRILTTRDGNSLLDGEAAKAMRATNPTKVRFWKNDLEVLQAVVCLLAVLVMDIFVALELSAKGLFHHPSMLGHVPVPSHAWDGDGHIAIRPLDSPPLRGFFSTGSRTVAAPADYRFCRDDHGLTAFAAFAFAFPPRQPHTRRGAIDASRFVRSLFPAMRARPSFFPVPPIGALAGAKSIRFVGFALETLATNLASVAIPYNLARVIARSGTKDVGVEWVCNNKSFPALSAVAFIHSPIVCASRANKQ
jgi:hypothetical protein